MTSGINLERLLMWESIAGGKCEMKFPKMTPSMFKMFGITSVMYLISGFWMIRENRSRHR